MGFAQVSCLLLLVALSYVQSAPFAKKSNEGFDVKSKRPFCNAFTGCGRKRSDPSFNELMAAETDNGGEMGDEEIWNQIEANYPEMYRGTDGQRRYGFFPGVFRKKRAAEKEEIQ